MPVLRPKGILENLQSRLHRGQVSIKMSRRSCLSAPHVRLRETWNNSVWVGFWPTVPFERRRLGVLAADPRPTYRTRGPLGVAPAPISSHCRLPSR
jgi:hypothetical protein